MRRHPNKTENKGGESASFSCARNNSARKNPFRRQREKKKDIQGGFYILSPRKEGETHTSHYVYSIQVRLIDHAFFFPPTPSLRYTYGPILICFVAMASDAVTYIYTPFSNREKKGKLPMFSVLTIPLYAADCRALF